MKKVLFFTILLNSLFIDSSIGQDTTETHKIKEFYFSVNNFSPVSVSLQWKRQINNTTFFKLGLINLNGNVSQVTPNNSIQFPEKSFSYSAGINLGVEWRKEITKALTFFHGPNISFTYRYSDVKRENPALPNKLRKNKNIAYIPGLSYTLGIIMPIRNNFYFSGEINPGFLATYQINQYLSDPLQNTEQLNIRGEVSNSAKVSIIYRY